MDEKKTISIPQLRALREVERRKMRQLVSQRRMTERLNAQNTAVQNALREIGEKDTIESLIPLGGGVFVEGKIAANSYKRTLPGNIVIPTTKGDIQKDLEERQKIIDEEIGILSKQILETSINLQNLQAVLQMVKTQRLKQER